MSLRLAKMEEIPEICRAFQKYEKELKRNGQPPIFSFVRQDYLKRAVKSKTLYYDHGVIAVLKQYKVRSKYGARKGDWSIPEILNTTNNPLNAIYFLKKVVREKLNDSSLWGTIRDDNKNSIEYHEAFGFQRVADISWSKGTVPGGIYVYEK